MIMFLMSAVGATPDKYNRCRSFRPHTLKTVYMTALTDCPIRCRALAFPSAADLFDVQPSQS